jgi:hypothetical protein
MFHVTVPLTVTFLSINCKINQEQYLARFSKVQVWQNSKIQSCFDLRLCDFGQPYSILPRHFSLSCQTNILINHWVLHKSLNNLARTWKILHDAISGQNERLASCNHMHLVMAWEDGQQQAVDF